MKFCAFEPNAYCGILSFLCLLFYPTPAHAYIDPGAGSLIWQVLIALVLTVPYLTKKYWNGIIGFFKRRLIAHADERENGTDR